MIVIGLSPDFKFWIGLDCEKLFEHKSFEEDQKGLKRCEIIKEEQILGSRLKYLILWLLIAAHGVLRKSFMTRL